MSNEDGQKEGTVEAFEPALRSDVAVNSNSEQRCGSRQPA